MIGPIRSLWRQAREHSKIKRSGTPRQQERLGLLFRPNYAYGLFRAADMAKLLGKSRVTVCEFGVATGNGLINLIELAEPISKETGVSFRIVGFDSGEGLLELEGYKDHPELWSPGDFAMVNRDQLLGRVAGRAELIFGDIKNTIGAFTAKLSPEAPLGFVSIDVDVYSGTKHAFQIFNGPAENYAPAVSMYFDDVSFFFANRWCGELAAIEEFNEDNDVRKIDNDRSLPGFRPQKDMTWYNHMFVAHILDHPLRSKPQERKGLSLEEHFALMKHLA